MGHLGSTLALALLLALVASPREARAGATVDLLFVGVNGIPIAPTNTVSYFCFPLTCELTMAIRMRNDQPLQIAVFSLNYDLDGKNELDVLSQFQWSGVPINKTASDFFAPVGGFSPTTATFVGSFQGASTNAFRAMPASGGAFAGGYQMGTVVWKLAAGQANDGADILSGILNFGVDFFGDAVSNDINNQILFRSATINLGDDPPPIPEPAAGALLGLGVVGLALLRRRGRKGG